MCYVNNFFFFNFTAFVFKDLGPNKTTKIDSAINSTYYISRKLGSGACGVVRLVYDKLTCLEYAMKHVKKNGLVETARAKSINEAERVMNEVYIMKSLDHVSHFDCFFVLSYLFVLLKSNLHFFNLNNTYKLNIL